MTEKDFQTLINNKRDLYQVFLFTCPGALPFSLAMHPWFVCVKKGEVSRWEICFQKSRCKTSWGYLHLNVLPPSQGIEVFSFSQKYFWEGKLIAQTEGDENSMARKMINFIEKSKENYPYCHQYFITGPNSNTYAQWILNNFPDFKIKLPWNAFGKNYKI